MLSTFRNAMSKWETLSMKNKSFAGDEIISFAASQITCKRLQAIVKVSVPMEKAKGRKEGLKFTPIATT